MTTHLERISFLQFFASSIALRNHRTERMYQMLPGPHGPLGISAALRADLVSSAGHLKAMLGNSVMKDVRHESV